VTDDREDDDATSLMSRDELARDDIDDLLEAESINSVGTDMAGTGLPVTVCPSSADELQDSRGFPTVSGENRTPSPVAIIQQTTLAESAVGSQNVLPAGVDRLPIASSSSVVVPATKSSDISSSVPSSVKVVKAAAVTSTTEPVVTTHTARGRTTSSKMAAMPPLAKKGLTHLLNSSSALFHRKRQLQTDSDRKVLSVGYSGSSVSLPSAPTESSALLDSSPSSTSTEAGTEPQGQNIDASIVPVVCDDEMFLMVKDDLCQKPANSVDKTEELLSSSSLSRKDSEISLKTSLPSTEVLNNLTDKDDKSTSDTISIKSRQVVVESLFLLSKHVRLQLKGSVKEPNILIYFFFSPSLNRVLFPMFCLLVEGECQILVF